MKLRFEHFLQKNPSMDALYPHKFERSMTVEQFIETFQHLKPADSLKVSYVINLF
jgi:hypothetical protein